MGGGVTPAQSSQWDYQCVFVGEWGHIHLMLQCVFSNVTLCVRQEETGATEHQGPLPCEKKH